MKGAGGKSPEGEYEGYRGLVLGMLARRFRRLDEDERLAIYHEAWARVYAKREAGEEIESLRAYLLATAAGEALHALSRGKPPTPLGPDDPRLATLADDRAPVDEEVVLRDQARIARDLLDSLDERQRDVLKLRWDLQLTGSEVRSVLGLSRRQYQRLVEEGAVAVSERVREFESGDWSRRQRSLLTACLVEVTTDGERRAGIASRRQRERAQRLLESDPHVAALYAEVRDALRGATALFPLPVMAVGAHSSPLGRLAELASETRSHVASALESAKQQATSLYVRTADPTLLTSTPRPGTAAVAVAGCLALGGGAYTAGQAISTSSPPSTASAAVEQAPTTFTKPPAPPPATPPTQHSATRKPDHHPKPTPQQPEDQPMPTPTPQPASQPPTPAPPTSEFGFED